MEKYKDIYISILVMQWLLTAGKAKNEMPHIAQKAAISLPAHVIGTVSP